MLQCAIRMDGSADDIRVMRGLGYGLDEAAMNAVTSKWRFKHGIRNEKPVDVRANIEISFRLK